MEVHRYYYGWFTRLPVHQKRCIMTLKYTLLLWQISVHSVFSRYLDSLFFSILGWMADVRKGGKHVKIGENYVLIFQNVVRLATHLRGPQIQPPPPTPPKKNKTRNLRRNGFRAYFVSLSSRFIKPCENYHPQTKARNENTWNLYWISVEENKTWTFFSGKKGPSDNSSKSQDMLLLYFLE